MWNAHRQFRSQPSGVQAVRPYRFLTAAGLSAPLCAVPCKWRIGYRRPARPWACPDGWDLVLGAMVQDCEVGSMVVRRVSSLGGTVRVRLIAWFPVPMPLRPGRFRLMACSDVGGQSYWAKESGVLKRRRDNSELSWFVVVHIRLVGVRAGTAYHHFPF